MAVKNKEELKSKVSTFIEKHLSFITYFWNEQFNNAFFLVLKDDEVRKEYKQLLIDSWEKKSNVSWLDEPLDDSDCLNEYFFSLVEKVCDQKYDTEVSNAWEVHNYNFIINKKIVTISLDTY
jgi:hypothetical protein